MGGFMAYCGSITDKAAGFPGLFPSRGKSGFPARMTPVLKLYWNCVGPVLGSYWAPFHG